MIQSPEWIESDIIRRSKPHGRRVDLVGKPFHDRAAFQY